MSKVQQFCASPMCKGKGGGGKVQIFLWYEDCGAMGLGGPFHNQVLVIELQDWKNEGKR